MLSEVFDGIKSVRGEAVLSVDEGVAVGRLLVKTLNIDILESGILVTIIHPSLYAGLDNIFRVVREIAIAEGLCEGPCFEICGRKKSVLHSSLVHKCQHSSQGKH